MIWSIFSQGQPNCLKERHSSSMNKLVRPAQYEVFVCLTPGYKTHPRPVAYCMLFLGEYHLPDSAVCVLCWTAVLASTAACIIDCYSFSTSTWLWCELTSWSLQVGIKFCCCRFSISSLKSVNHRCIVKSDLQETATSTANGRQGAYTFWNHAKSC